VVVWAIASTEAESQVAAFAEYFDLDLPVLMDADGSVHAKYNMPMAFPTGAYPQEWLIDTEGKIHSWSNRFDADVVISSIEALLEE
jgi:peroxiredoxin